MYAHNIPNCHGLVQCIPLLPEKSAITNNKRQEYVRSLQGCVRGQHGRGQGQGSSRPRPPNFVLEMSSRSRPVLEDPVPGFFTAEATQRAVMPRHLSVHHSQIERPTAASCALVYEVLYLWYWVLYLLTILKNSTSYGQISKPKPRPRIIEAKARGLRGQGHKILWSRPVLKDPSPQGPHPWLIVHSL